MSVEELTREAVELIQLRQDVAALRTALERATTERDNWRGIAMRMQQRQSQAIHRLHATIKEAFS